MLLYLCKQRGPYALLLGFFAEKEDLMQFVLTEKDALMPRRVFFSQKKEDLHYAMFFCSLSAVGFESVILFAWIVSGIMFVLRTEFKEQQTVQQRSYCKHVHVLIPVETAARMKGNQ